MCKHYPNCNHQGPLAPQDKQKTRHCLLVGANRRACKYLPSCLGCTFKNEVEIIAQAVTPPKPKPKGPSPVVIRKDYEEQQQK